MSFVDELKRRNVVRVGVAYVVIGWVLAQIAEFAFDNFGAPDWVLKSVVVLLLLGLPIALLFAWAFEVTPEGIKREKDVDRSTSITSQTGRKIDYLIIGVLVLAVGFLAYDKLRSDDAAPAITGIEQSIAVLPFVNMSDDADHFADGLTEELLNLLAKNQDLKVAGRTSSFAFKGQNDDLRTIGEALGVEKVLEGSVRRSGVRLRVTAQLINVADGFHIWSETYDRELADVFDIQDEVAGAITKALKLHLSPASERLTENADAYARYVEAVALSSFDTDDDMRAGVKLLEEAITLDPSFAKAYELKAFYHWMSAGWIIESAAGQLQVFESASRALNLDPSLASAKSLKRTSDPSNWSWIIELESLEELAESVKSVRVLDTYGYTLNNTGYFSEAEDQYRTVTELDPLSSGAIWRLGDSLATQGRYEEAAAEWTKAATMGNDSGHYRLATYSLILRKDEEAAKYLEVVAESPASYGYSSYEEMIQAIRDPASGREALDDWINQRVEAAPIVAYRNAAYSYYLAFGYMDKFQELIDEFSSTGAVWNDGGDLEVTGLILRSSGFTSHPAYVARAKRTGLTDLWDKRGAPDHCSKASGDWVCN